MKLKYRYIWKYLCFRALPVMLVALALSGMLFYISGNIENRRELIAMTVFGFAMCAGTFGYFIWNICRFSILIDRQGKQYGIEFCDDGAVTVSAVSEWVILAKDWLILPGKIALCRKHIDRVSITERNEWGGIRYQIRLKSNTGQSFYIRFRKPESATKVQKWAKQKINYGVTQ